jgi:hypothetical protein
MQEADPIMQHEKLFGGLLNPSASNLSKNYLRQV